MTREEREKARKHLEDILEEATEYESAVCYVTGEDAEALEIAIKSLSAEPCDDAISRKSVIDVLTRNRVHFCDMVRITSELKELPPVTPEATECEDIISRILERMWNCRGKHTTSIDKVKMEQIIRENLHSVTPKQKMGRWELVYRDGGVEHYLCNKCRKGRAMIDDDFYRKLMDFKYCPNCGAKMESEDSE